MIAKHIGEGVFQHPVGTVKIQPCHILKTHHQHRVLVHPLPAEVLMLRDGKPLKQRLAVLSNVEEALHHPHHQGLPKASGASEQGDLVFAHLQQFVEQLRLIDVVGPALPQFLEVLSADEHLH